MSPDIVCDAEMPVSRHQSWRERETERQSTSRQVEMSCGFLLVGMQTGNVPSIFEGVWPILRKLHLLFPHNPESTFSGIYPKELRIYAHTKFALRCPSVGEWRNQWRNKLWSIQTREFYSALRRNELSSHEETWRKLKCVGLSARSQFEAATCCVIQLWGEGPASPSPSAPPPFVLSQINKILRRKRIILMSCYNKT
uniref:Uncharacterized protein n=1 Tax=Mustela putorius furo TaxID=9669 RepID=M3YJH8_MUSPF